MSYFGGDKCHFIHSIKSTGYCRCLQLVAILRPDDHRAQGLTVVRSSGFAGLA